MVNNVCKVDGCEVKRSALGYCNRHYQRVLKYGDPSVYFGRTGRPVTGEHPTFIAIHARLRRIRGRARDFACVDCSGPAREWSYNNADPNAVTGRQGRFEVKYSLDIRNYDPRCVPCHRRFDFLARKSVGA